MIGMHMWRPVTIVALATLLFACGIADTGNETGGQNDTSGQSVPTFASLYNGYFQACRSCHAAGAPGYTADIEKNLDFSTIDTAYNSITGKTASGLVGNQEACNGLSFIGPTYDTSLLVATLDENVRASFSAGDCNIDTISDMTVKSGGFPDAAFLSDLKDWISAGASF